LSISYETLFAHRHNAGGLLGRFLFDEWILKGALRQHGIHPRKMSSLLGILWSPFLHMSIGHLMANSLPLLILGGIISLRSRVDFFEITAGGILLGGFLTWLFARNGVHVGASGLIFCYFGFLTSRAWFDRSILNILFGGNLHGGLRRDLNRPVAYLVTSLMGRSRRGITGRGSVRACHDD